MDDITIIMLTPNLVPKKWAQFHRKVLTEAIGDTPIITISKEPLDWGINLLQTEYGYPNIYKQMLRGAKLATTKYIAMVDDDTLYPKAHFQFRPPEDGFYYNFNRWHILTYGKPIYFHKPRHGNGCIIATRKLVIEAMERRIEKCPELSHYFTRELGSDRRMMQFDHIDAKSFYTNDAILSFTQQPKKYVWPVRAYDIPFWGKAEDIIKEFV